MGILTLNRPEDGNRLTEGMHAALTTSLLKHEKNREIYAVALEAAGLPGAPGAFCLGEAQADPTTSDAHAALTAAATTIWRIDRSAKPFVSLISGAAAGTGLGLVLHGTHSVAAGSATFAVSQGPAEVLLGGGLSQLLPRLPGHLGLYMALSRRPIDRALAYRIGMITHCTDSDRFAEIRQRLADADPIDEVLDGLHVEPGPSALDRHLATIAECFGLGSPQAIVLALRSVMGREAEWARGLADEIALRSPERLELIVAMLTNHPPQSLREALALEVRAAGGGDLSLPPEPQAPSIS